MSEGAAVNETGVKAGVPPRGQAVKSADPQGWSAEGGEAEGGSNSEAVEWFLVWLL